MNKALCFTIPGTPIAKPRMTRRDRWAQRTCVLTYRAWADQARAAAAHAGLASSCPCTYLHLRAFLPLPASWSEKKRKTHGGVWHRQKPDLDNLVKAVCDALWPVNDAAVAHITASKYWDDGQGPRVEVEIR